MEDYTNPNLEQIYHEYDKIVAEAVGRMIGLSLKEQTINLLNFDRKNKEHLFVLQIATMISGIYKYEIKVQTNWWNIICLKFKNRKMAKIKRIKKNEDGINTSKFVKLITPINNELLGENFSVSEIYKVYYERKNKNV